MFSIFNKKQKTIIHGVPDYIVYNVDNFNRWFNAPNKPSYANPGIYLRVDKLGHSFIEDYLKECYGMNHDHSDYAKISVLYDQVRKDWLTKLK